MKTLPVHLLCVLLGCGDDGGTFTDAALPDPCAPNMTFTGELVDWDSGASFMGVPQATFTHRADMSATSTTAPNGRFDMCIPAADGFVDITTPPGLYRIDGTVVVSRAVLGVQPVQSYRSLTQTRAVDLGFSTSNAHVFVHVHGGARTVTVAPAVGIQKVFDGTSWVDGNTGTDIYLGNIAPQAVTTLTVSGGDSLGGGEIPLTAGELTYVTVIAR